MPAVAGPLLGVLCAVTILFGMAPAAANAATVGCGRVTTFVAPDSQDALANRDGWVIFAKPDGTSEKVIVRSGTLTASGAIAGYICIGIDGVYFTGLLAPGAAGYVPEPANWETGTGIYCGTVAVNPFASGQLAGPRTFRLTGPLSGFGAGTFSVPASSALPAVGSYLCGRFAVGAPSVLLAVLRPGDPGYAAAGLPNTATTPADATVILGLGGTLLVTGLALLALGARRDRRG